MPPRGGGWHCAPPPNPSEPHAPPRQFLFVVTFSTFLLCCVEYDVLFANRPLNHSQVPAPERSKVTLPDAILPAPQCAQR